MTKIVFLTCSPDYAVESYRVKASGYILKPVSKENLFPVLDDLLLEAARPQEGLRIKTQKGFINILFSQIVFVEIMHKILYFHLADGSIREINSTLAAFENKLLSRPNFVKVHRSYVVNLWHIREFSPRKLVTSTGETIPISRLLYSKVRSAYMEQLFTEN